MPSLANPTMKKQLVGIAILLAVCQAGFAQVADESSPFALPDLELEQSDNSTDWNALPEERFSFFTIRDKRYYIGGLLKVNWYKAQQLCAYSGLTLATISSPVDAQRLESLLLESPVQVDDARFWLSGTELAQRGSWVWNSNGLPITFARWQSQRQNVWDSSCMLLNDDHRTWSNLHCNTPLYFICESRCQGDTV